MVKRTYKIDDEKSIEAEDYSYNGDWKKHINGGIVVLLKGIQDEEPFQTEFHIYKDYKSIPEGIWEHVVIIRDA